MAIPLYANSHNETHCVQATLKMVLAYIRPNRVFSFEELDEETNHDPEGWTWDTSVLWFLHRIGLTAYVIDPFDFVAFSTHGVDFLRQNLSNEAFEIQALNADLEKEVAVAKKLLAENSTNTYEQRPGTWEDIHRLYNEEWIVIAKCDSFILDEEEQDGSDSHYLIVTQISEEFIWVNDCGNPAQQNRMVQKDLFEKARREVSGIIAIKDL